MSCRILDCSDLNWPEKLEASLADGTEVDLANFIFEVHGAKCEILARNYGMQFTLDRDPKEKAAHFRNEQDFGPRVAKKDRQS